MFWTWQIRRGKRGRPSISIKAQDLIRRHYRKSLTKHPSGIFTQLHASCEAKISPPLEAFFEKDLQQPQPGTEAFHRKDRELSIMVCSVSLPSRIDAAGLLPRVAITMRSH